MKILRLGSLLVFFFISIAIAGCTQGEASTNQSSLFKATGAGAPPLLEEANWDEVSWDETVWA